MENQKGHKVIMQLAGHVMQEGMMTGNGEVMIKTDNPKSTHDIGWIFPMIRGQAELGMEARWRCDGTAVLIHPSGEEVPLIRDQGLYVLEWNQFEPHTKTADGKSSAGKT